MIYYREGVKYQLAKDYNHTLSVNIHLENTIETEYLDLDKETLFIRKGYAWDGCSGPTKDTASNMRAGLVHDALYQLMRMKKLPLEYRDKADKELYNIFIQDGYSIYKNKIMRVLVNIRAKIFYDAVRAVAGFAADPKNVKVIRKAP